MKLKKWLKNIDPICLTIVVWEKGVPEEEGPVYEGNAYDLPWWVAEGKLVSEDPYELPISFRDSLGPDHNNKPGIVVTVEFKKV